MNSSSYLLFLLVGSLSAQAQTTQIESTKAEIRKIDDFIDGKDNPNNLMPNRQFAELVREGQRFVSGNAVQEGKIAGTSAVVTDKAIAVNVGTNVIANRFSGQLNLLGTSQDGVVNLIKTGAYQNTLSVGASGNLFVRGFKNNTFYWSRPDERQRLWQTLLYLRNQDRATYPNCTPCEGCVQQLAQYDLLAAPLCSLYNAHKALVIARWQRLQDPCDNDSAFYNSFRSALDKLKALQPPNWVALDTAQAQKWLDSICCKATRDTMVMLAKQRAENAAITKQLARYDSTILQAKWATRRIVWLNGGILHNSTKLTRFATNQPSFQSGDWNNQTTTFTSSINIVQLKEKSRFYLSIGAQFINHLNQLDDSLHTRYRTRSITALAPPVTVLDSVQAYRAGVHLPRQLTLNAEFSYYSLAAKVGFDATYKHYNPALKGSGWLATLGVFFPIVAADASTILLMPQVSYNSRDKFSFGASLAASIPGFFTRTEKP